MKVGLMGLPQVGKQTLFELLTGQAPAQARLNAKDQNEVQRVERYLNALTTLKARFAQYTNSGRVKNNIIIRIFYKC